MKDHIPLLFLSLFPFFLFTTFPKSNSQEQETTTKYSNCIKPFNCGSLPPILFPFWGDVERPRYCGGRNEFKLSNCSDPYQYPSLHTNSHQFQVFHINSNNYTMAMKMVREDADYETCDPPLSNNTLSPTLFQYTQNVYNITVFYDCSYHVSFAKNLTCPSNYNEYVFYVDEKIDPYKISELEHICGNRSILHVMPDSVVEPVASFIDLKEVVEKGFEVYYDSIREDELNCKRCRDSKGICGRTDTDQYQFSCHCPDGYEASLQCQSNTKNPWNWKRKVIIGVSAAVFGALVVLLAMYLYQRRKKNRYTMSYVSQSFTTSDPSLVKDPEKGSQYFGVHVFTYDELEEATNNFDSDRELGDGGFGTVYYGQLHDGRRVAVKKLYENNYRRVEQFMNEVEILTRLRHPNLVSLFGCTSRHSRELLLVYEYISNGTVADHLHGGKTKPGALPWHIRMNIAVDTASALKYLHASDIIHRDVKTNNILLDDHFCVKVADFGLSRLFPTHATHISTAPQGTPGYVDPEYHQCYQLTSKSDVYSFGVMLIELISSLPAVDITRHRHEINLSNMAINKIQNQALHELVDPALGFESDYKVRKMINAVAELAFRCLQSSKDMRPSMEEVVDTLLDIQSDGKHKKSQPEVLDISADDDVVLLKDDPPPPSPDSNLVSKSTTPNASG
ncbi:hypothetical protein Lal_00045408 [Lupinus albus]|uniref:non-specific serine/threonine protein kinase n=1 Tax=Lupinus albus TaxID=3870 RepID=A0A6A5NN92_LUPAL|nr:putative protein kinase RLK-Pelle-WAK-LRK10L-1 family [Lupinus albus]KAF1886178.1 hypothetical protein Lal_00045408 [Lupinus albus]